MREMLLCAMDLSISLKTSWFPAFPNPFWIFGSQLGYLLGFEELGNANNIQLGEIISEFLFSLARIWNTQFYYIIQVHCSALKVAICPPVFQTTQSGFTDPRLCRLCCLPCGSGLCIGASSFIGQPEVPLLRSAFLRPLKASPYFLLPLACLIQLDPLLWVSL